MPRLSALGGGVADAAVTVTGVVVEAAAAEGLPVGIVRRTAAPPRSAASRHPLPASYPTKQR